MTIRIEVRPRVVVGEAMGARSNRHEKGTRLGWLAPYWLGALAFAYAIHADILPVQRWLRPASAEPAPGAKPKVDGAAWSEGAFGLAWGREVGQSADDAPSAESRSAPSDAQAVYGVMFTVEPEAGLSLEAADAPGPAAAVAPAAVALGRGVMGPRRARQSRPASPKTNANRARAAREALAWARGLSAIELAPDPAGRAAARVRPLHELAAAPRESWGKASGSISCEAARAAYSEELHVGEGAGSPDISPGRYAAVLNSGAYFRHCGVPATTGVRICAAVQNGRAQGVTVWTSPPDPRLGGCVAAAVRGLSFPQGSRLDVVTTTFAAER